ncbi:MAG: DUF1116 domain-containing protein [Lentisphaerae bacterium]|nr:DUF1116 domain-containing protein [Lentisphaerota bacterium]
MTCPDEKRNEYREPAAIVRAYQRQLGELRESPLADKIAAANAKVIESLLDADPCWIDMKPALDVVPGLKPNMILKSGPPLPWDQLCATQRLGICNGILYEGLATSEAEAEKLVRMGRVEFHPANDFAVVCPGAGIVTPSMIVNVVEDRHSGKRGYCVPFEGPNRGGLGGWGVYNANIKQYLDLLREAVGPVFAKMLHRAEGIPTKEIIARGVEMGDETHLRQEAETPILVNKLFSLLFAEPDIPADALRCCVDFLEKTPRLFHPLGMASAMATLQSMKHVEYSTVVTAQVGNGVEYGIKISSLGDQWFTAPAPQLKGALLSADARQEDILPWIGDSCTLEAIGLGGFAAAASPAVARQMGGTFADAIARSRELAAICLCENRNFLLPALDYAGSPAGIDMLKVLATGMQPLLYGGMIAKTGKRVGVGMARVPLECFAKAFAAFAAKYRAAGRG